MKSKNPKKLILIIAPLVYLAVSIIIVAVIKSNNGYPAGDDTFYHLYRGEWIYNSIKDGNLFPILNMNWYNGVELQRFWSPLAAYYSAFCQFVCGGDILKGYLLFVGSVCFLGALPWLYIGHKEGREFLCAFLGLYWFFVPNNLYALFTEGNLARSLSMIFLPLLVYFTMSYLREQNYKKMIAVAVLMLLMLLCHVGYGGMVALTFIGFFIIYGIITKRKAPGLELIIAMLLSFVIYGIWLLPFLLSDVPGVDSSETMVNFFQSFWLSINPAERIRDLIEHFYYGLSFFIIGVFGIIFSKRAEKAGFITAILYLVLSSQSMYVVLKHLPGSKYLWMLRFFSIIIAITLISLVYWKSLRRSILVVLSVLMVLDVIPSLPYFTMNTDGLAADERLESISDATLISEAKEITTQRLALLDLSSLIARGSYIISGGDNGVAATFGAGWEASGTSTNIVQLNKAVSEGYYPYLFDRCLELGNDTVLIRLSRAQLYTYTIEDIKSAAAASGYYPAAENYDYLLFKNTSVPSGAFGVVSKFKAIGIGTGAPGISLQFPGVEETDTTKLDDFTYDDLKDYELIYLDGFTYDDRAYAEDLILKLSENGVRVVICADGIPEDRKSHDQSFLGVVCHTISFSNGYPELDTIDGVLNTDLFPQGYEDWQTVYLEGLDTVWGKIYDAELDLPFYGCGTNKNLIYIGVNLTYFYGLTRDEAVGDLLSHAMEFNPNELPERTIVSLTIDYNNSDGTLTVISEEDNVNTTLAWHDFYGAEESAVKKNNLTYVDAGTTVFKIKYPYLLPGLLVTVVGILLLAGFALIIKKEYSSKDNP